MRKDSTKTNAFRWSPKEGRYPPGVTSLCFSSCYLTRMCLRPALPQMLHPLQSLAVRCGDLLPANNHSGHLALLAGVVSTWPWVLMTTTKLPTSDKHMPLKTGCCSLQLNTSFGDYSPNLPLLEPSWSVKYVLVLAIVRRTKTDGFLNSCLRGMVGRAHVCLGSSLLPLTPPVQTARLPELVPSSWLHWPLPGSISAALRSPAEALVQCLKLHNLILRWEPHILHIPLLMSIHMLKVEGQQVSGIYSEEKAKTEGVPALRGGSRHEFPSLTKILSPIEDHLQRKN